MNNLWTTPFMQYNPWASNAGPGYTPIRRWWAPQNEYQWKLFVNVKQHLRNILTSRDRNIGIDVTILYDLLTADISAFSAVVGQLRFIEMGFGNYREWLFHVDDIFELRGDVFNNMYLFDGCAHKNDALAINYLLLEPITTATARYTRRREDTFPLSPQYLLIGNRFPPPNCSPSPRYNYHQLDPYQNQSPTTSNTQHQQQGQACSQNTVSVAMDTAAAIDSTAMAQASKNSEVVDENAIGKSETISETINKSNFASKQGCPVKAVGRRAPRRREPFEPPIPPSRSTSCSLLKKPELGSSHSSLGASSVKRRSRRSRDARRNERKRETESQNQLKTSGHNATLTKETKVPTLIEAAAAVCERMPITVKNEIKVEQTVAEEIVVVSPPQSNNTEDQVNVQLSDPIDTVQKKPVVNGLAVTHPIVSVTPPRDLQINVCDDVEKPKQNGEPNQQIENQIKIEESVIELCRNIDPDTLMKQIVGELSNLQLNQKKIKKQKEEIQDKVPLNESKVGNRPSVNSRTSMSMSMNCCSSNEKLENQIEILKKNCCPVTQSSSPVIIPTVTTTNQKPIATVSISHLPLNNVNDVVKQFDLDHSSWSEFRLLGVDSFGFFILTFPAASVKNNDYKTMMKKLASYYSSAGSRNKCCLKQEEMTNGKFIVAQIKHYMSPSFDSASSTSAPSTSKYIRAKIFDLLDKDRQIYSCIGVDDFQEYIVPYSSIFRIVPDFTQLPSRVFKCILHGSEPRFLRNDLMKAFHKLESNSEKIRLRGVTVRKMSFNKLYNSPVVQIRTSFHEDLFKLLVDMRYSVVQWCELGENPRNRKKTVDKIDNKYSSIETAKLSLYQQDALKELTKRAYLTVD